MQREDVLTKLAAGEMTVEEATRFLEECENNTGPSAESNAVAKSDLNEIENLVDESAPVGWICPQPDHWKQVYEMLPDRVGSSTEKNPPLPLILGGWWYSTPTQKKERFLAHLRWAARLGVLDTVLAKVRRLEETDWYLGD